MPKNHPGLSEKMGRAILDELKAIRANQEAQMPDHLVVAARQSRVKGMPVQEQETEQARVDRRLSNLRSKGD